MEHMQVYRKSELCKICSSVCHLAALHKIQSDLTLTLFATGPSKEQSFHASVMYGSLLFNWVFDVTVQGKRIVFKPHVLQNLTCQI